MKLKLLFATLPFIFLFSCSKDDDSVTQPSTTITYKATLSGEQEVPTHSSNATGSFIGIYDQATQTMDYNLKWTVVPNTVFMPTVAHMHKGTSGTDGNAIIIFDLGSAAATPLTGTLNISADQLTDLNNGSIYVHIHSNAFPNGDIRGQITRQ